MARYYISPDGDDTKQGNKGNPWKTFAFAIAQLVPGDELILLDGVYEADTTGLPDIREIDGLENALITIKAETERNAHLKSDGGRPAFFMSGCEYWDIIGLQGSMADKQTLDSGWGAPVHIFDVQSSKNIQAFRLLAHHNNRYFNSMAINFGLCEDSLMEECEAYYFHRNGIIAWQGTNVVQRRCYANSRGYGDIEGGYPSHEGAQDRGDAGTTLYLCDDSITENCISEGNEGVNASGKRDKLLGCISIDDINGAIYSSAFNGISEDITFEHCLALNSPGNAIWMRSVTDGKVRYCTAVGNASAGFVADNPYAGKHEGQLPPSLSLTNSLFLNNGYAGVVIYDDDEFESLEFDLLNSYNNRYNYLPPELFTGQASVDPCFRRATYVYNSGINPLIGANILYRYENGELTSTPLWDPETGAFPHGAIVEGVNDDTLESACNVHKRLGISPATLPYNGLPTYYISIAELRAAPYSITEIEATDDLLTLFLDLTKNQILQLCNQRFDYDDKTYIFNGTGHDTLWLPDRIICLSSVKIDGKAVSIDKFKLKDWFIVYEDWNFPEGTNNIEITGTFGWTSVPTAIKRLQGRLIENMIRPKKDKGQFRSESISDYSYQRGNMEGYILGDPELDLIVRRYRMTRPFGV